MAQVGWYGPFSFTLREGERGISWNTWSDYNEDGIDNEYTNEPHHYEFIGGTNSGVLEFSGNGVQISESYMENYNGFESGPNYFDFTIKATYSFYVGNELYETIGYHSFNFTITDLPPAAQAEATLESGYVLETAQAGDTVILSYPYNQNQPYEFDEGRFSDGTGDGTVTLRDDAGGRFRLDHVDGKYVLKVASTDLIDADIGTRYKVALDISDGTTTVTNYIDIDVWNVSPTNLRNVGGNATINEHSAVGTAVGITAKADEAKTGNVTYSIGYQYQYLPIAIDANTGVVTVADSEQLNFERFRYTDGKITFDVDARDETGGLTTQAFTLTIKDVNDAPKFSRYAETDITYRENGTDAVGTFRATDEDEVPQPNVVTHSLTGADASKFTINATTGEVRFKASPDFEAKADADHDNVYRFNVVASDGTASTAQAVKVTLTNANEAPVIAGGPTKTLSFVEGTSTSTILYKLSATDPDAGANLTYGLVANYDRADFDMDANGNLRFRYSPDYDYPYDQGQDHVYNLVAYAWDGENQATQNIVVRITQAIPNRAPVITSNGRGTTASVNLLENVASVTKVTATDADVGTSLAYSLAGGADHALFTIDARSGALAFRTAPDFETKRDANKDGIYQVAVRVSDGALSDTQTLSVKVLDVKGITKSGGTGPDTINGSVEADTLSGMGGNDTIKALVGSDVITGGTGADKLYGGVDTVRDTFVFAKGDSGSSKQGASTWDTVFDFKSGVDKIDLSRIDADAFLSGTQDLRYVTTFKKAVAKDSVADGQYRLVDEGAHVRVEIDINGDTAADMVLRVMNVATLKPGISGDFLL